MHVFDPDSDFGTYTIMAMFAKKPKYITMIDPAFICIANVDIKAFQFILGGNCDSKIFGACSEFRPI